MTDQATARVSVSAICTFDWSLEQDLAFYAEHGITNVGISLVKLERHGWIDGAARVRDAGLRVTNLIGLGPFHLSRPDQWDQQRERLLHALDAGVTVSAECLVVTTGPAGSMTWEEAADALEAALTPVLAIARERAIPFALEHTNSLRVDVGFVHTLTDVVDLARRLDIGVCMEVNACWAERGLGATIASSMDRIRLVQVSDFAAGTLSTPNRLVPGDGDVPLDRILGQVLDAGYTGCFDLELIGPAIEAEGYAAAVAARGGPPRRAPRVPFLIGSADPGDLTEVEAARREQPARTRGGGTRPEGQPELRREVRLGRRLQPQVRERRLLGRGRSRGFQRCQQPRAGRLRKVLPHDRVEDDGRHARGRLSELFGQPILGSCSGDVDGAPGRDVERGREAVGCAPPGRARRRTTA